MLMKGETRDRGGDTSDSGYTDALYAGAEAQALVRLMSDMASVEPALSDEMPVTLVHCWSRLTAAAAAALYTLSPHRPDPDTVFLMHFTTLSVLQTSQTWHHTPDKKIFQCEVRQLNI